MSKRKATITDLAFEQWLRDRENGNIVWVNKEGDEIPINDISDVYLSGILNELVGFNKGYKEATRHYLNSKTLLDRSTDC